MEAVKIFFNLKLEFIIYFWIMELFQNVKATNLFPAHKKMYFAEFS